MRSILLFTILFLSFLVNPLPAQEPGAADDEQRFQPVKDLEMQGTFKGVPQTLNSYTEVAYSQRWTFVESPGGPELNFSPNVLLQYAGDVTGNGQTDFLTSVIARDERTDDLESTVGKTLVYFGGNYTVDYDQFHYEWLHPIGDINGSGHNDALAVPDNANDMFEIYTGTSNGYEAGGFQLYDIPAGNILTHYDLDGSGYHDIVMQYGSTDVRVLFGNDDLSFMAEHIYELADETDMDGISRLQLADVSGDGTAEILVNYHYQNESHLYVAGINESRELEMLQDSPFQEAFMVAMIPADFTGDGTPELYMDGRIYQLDNDSGEYDLSEYVETGVGTVVGDLDNSGKADVLFERDGQWHLAFGSDDLTGWEGDFSQDMQIDFPVEDVFPANISKLPGSSFGDISGNGVDDFLLGFETEDAFGRVYLIGDEGRDFEFEVLSLDRDAHSGDVVHLTFNLGDINDNGADDFALVHETPGKERVGIYFGGSGISGEPDIVVATPYRNVWRIVTGDFNGNGEPDVAFSLSADNKAQRWDDGHGVDEHTGIHIFTASGLVELGTQQDEVSLTEGLADHVIPYSSIGVTFTPGNFYSFGFVDNLGDFSGNGADDLIYANTRAPREQEDRIFITFGDSYETMSDEPDVRISEVSGEPLATGDVTGDGMPDFAVSNFGISDPVLLFFNDPDHDYSEPDLVLDHGSDDTILAGISVRTGDLNGNGIQDIVTKSSRNIENPDNLNIKIYYGGSEISTTPDRKISIPEEVLGLGSLGTLSVGSLEILPGFFDQERDAILHTGNPGFSEPNAWIFDGDEEAGDEPLFKLTGPNQDAGLGANNNIITYDGRNAVGDFTGDGNISVVLTQQRDNNDLATSSRVYLYETHLPVYAEESGENLPGHFTLEQNYPNPFNPETVISFRLPERSDVTLEVYDLLGRRVATLVDDQFSAGTYQVNWDATEQASGVYIYRLESGGYAETRQMTLIK